MTAAELVLGAIAGGLGAVLRHELTVGRPLHALHVVNVAGSALLGVVAGSELWTHPLAVAVAVGGLGGLTSFSSWMVGARDEARGRRAPGASLTGHVLLPAALAVAGAALGTAVGGALDGGWGGLA